MSREYRRRSPTISEERRDKNLELVCKSGSALQQINIKDRTIAICLAAVSNDGLALEFVENQTYQICMAAVRQNGMALRFVKNKTKEIIDVAIAQNPKASECIQI